MLNGADVAGRMTTGDSLLVGIVAFLSEGKAGVGEEDAEDEKGESGRVRLYHRISWLRSSAGQRCFMF